MWIRFLREAALRNGHDHVLHRKWPGPMPVRQQNQEERGGGFIFAKCDISSGLWGALETEDRRVQPLYTLSTLMGFSHPRLISEWPFNIIMAREGLS